MTEKLEVVDIHLGGKTPYTDYPAIPDRFALDFKINILPFQAEPTILHHSITADPDDGDVVSETIRALKTWEVPETIILSSAFKGADRENTAFVDIGCHVGWFSIIAQAYGIEVYAVDGDRRMLEALRRSSKQNAFPADLTTFRRMVDEKFNLDDAHLDDYKNLIVKIDVEGAENHAIAALQKSFDSQVVSQCLMEVSPCFEDYYPSLLQGIFDLGYEGYVMPLKRFPPPQFRHTDVFLRKHCKPLHPLGLERLSTWVQAQHQFDVILVRGEYVQWG